MAFQSIGEIIDELLGGLKDGSICRQCAFYDVMRGDSVLERSFWQKALRSADGWHGSADQFQIGRYRVDAVFDCGGRAVVIELDGKAYHDRAADHIRDKELIQQVDAIIRIPFAAMWWYPEATFAVLAEWFPRFKRADTVSACPLAELKEEYRGIQDSGDYVDSDYLSEIERYYQVWAVDGAWGQVGSPKSFLFYGTKQTISMQCGQTAPGMVERIYKKSKCDPHARHLRAA